MKVSQLFMEKLKSDSIRARVADILGLNYSTITRWYYYDNDKLNHLKVIEAVGKLTGLTLEDMIEQETEVK